MNGARGVGGGEGRDATAPAVESEGQHIGKQAECFK